MGEQTIKHNISEAKCLPFILYYSQWKSFWKFIKAAENLLEVHKKYGYLFFRTSYFYFFPQACCKSYVSKVMLQARKNSVAEITIFLFKKSEMNSCFHPLAYSNGFTSGVGYYCYFLNVSTQFLFSALVLWFLMRHHAWWRLQTFQSSCWIPAYCLY